MAEGSTLISVKVRTILTIKKILGKGEVELRLPEGTNLDDLLFSLISTYGEELTSHLFDQRSRHRVFEWTWNSAQRRG